MDADLTPFVVQAILVGAEVMGTAGGLNRSANARRTSGEPEPEGWPV